MTRKHLSYAEMMARRFTADHAVTRRRLLAHGAKVGAAFAAAPAIGRFAVGTVLAQGVVLREIGLSLTEDPRILSRFQEDTGITMEGNSQILGNQITAATVVLVALLLIFGSQFTLFAMWFDMESNKDLR